MSHPRSPSSGNRAGAGPAAAETGAAERREQAGSIWLGVLVSCATVIAYLPALKAGFIWNDEDYVTSPALQPLHGLARIWFKVGATEQYYPLLHSAFWLEHRAFGDRPAGYHLLNLLL